MSKVFKQNLSFFCDAFADGILDRIKGLTCCMVLSDDLVVRAAPGSTQGLVEAVKLEAGSKAKLHSIWDLLMRRDPTFERLDYLISELGFNDRVESVGPRCLPKFDIVFPIGDLATKVQISVYLADYWADRGRAVRERILDEYRKSIQALVDPMMMSFARKNDMKYKPLEIEQVCGSGI